MENETPNPKFTQRHYEALAAALSLVTNPVLQHQAAFLLADFLEQDNPRFKRALFLVKAIPSLTPQTIKNLQDAPY